MGLTLKTESQELATMRSTGVTIYFRMNSFFGKSHQQCNDDVSN